MIHDSDCTGAAYFYKLAWLAGVRLTPAPSRQSSIVGTTNHRPQTAAPHTLMTVVAMLSCTFQYHSLQSINESMGARFWIQCRAGRRACGVGGGGGGKHHVRLFSVSVLVLPPCHGLSVRLLVVRLGC